MSELITIEKKTIPDVFKKDGIDSIIEKIEQEVSSLVPDTSTAKGRKEISSTAHKVAKAKTYLDTLGKELVSDIKQQAKIIDQERKKARDRLDALKEKVRSPLTKWEEAETKRVSDIQVLIQRFKDIVISFDSSLAAKGALKQIELIALDDKFAEFIGDACKAKESAVSHLESEISRLEKYESEQAELEKLRKEQEEREREEREERIAREAAEKARREAEEKAEQEKLEAAKREQEAKEAALEAEREAERLRLAAIAEAERVEREKVEAAERAEREKQEAIEAAERKAKAEADRIERERLEAEAEEKRKAAIQAANKAHRAKINNAALSCLKDHGMTEAAGKKLIKAIAMGEIANITINY